MRLFIITILTLISLLGFSQIAPPTPGLYYKCNETTGTNVNDEIGTNDATLGATTTVNQTAATGMGSAFGYDGQNSSRMTVPNIALLAPGTTANFTFTCLVYPTSYPASNNGIIGGQDNGFSIAVDNTGHLKLTRISWGSATSTTATVPLNQWSFIAVTFDNSTYTNNIVYRINNTSQTVSWTAEFTAGAYSNLIGQGYNNLEKWVGRIDEIAVWNSVLTTSNLDYLYNSGNFRTYPFSNPPKQVPVAAKMVIPIWKIYGDPILGATGGGGGGTSADTIKYFLSENFEGRTSTDINTSTAMNNFWEMSTGQVHWSQQSIVNVGGQYGNVWHSYINSYYTNPTDCWSSMAIELPINDTTADFWADRDLFVPTDFDPFGVGNTGSHGPAHKIAIGGFMTNNSLLNWGVDGQGHSLMDTSTIAGRGGWAHDVATGGRSAGQPTYNMGYLYLQDQKPSSEWWNGYNSADSGFYQTNTGTWMHETIHIRINTPGKYDGFYEEYINGDLVIRYTMLKFRSITQGKDFGMVEAGSISFFQGGSETLDYAARRQNWTRQDNIVFYTYKPGAVNYRHKWRKYGQHCSQIHAPNTNIRPPKMMVDETYTNTSDTIFDVGNGKHYIYNPANMTGTTIITKTVSRPSGTINYTFNVAGHLPEFGFPPDDDTQDYYVKVYSGTGGSKVLLHTFGRTSRSPFPAREAPGTGTWTINNNTATFEFHTGWRGGDTRGVAIRYWQP